MLRTHTCGCLRKSDDTTEVTLCGWVHRRRDHGGIIFIDLRDRYGITQIVFDPEVNAEAHAKAEHIRSEWVLQVTGTVRLRGEDDTGKSLENPNLDTGEIEVFISDTEILNSSKTPPFEIDQDKDVREDLRLEYRYLDLRKERMAKNLRLRTDMAHTLRNFFHDEGFLEIETPIMIKGTPEGSREYLVPSRLHHGDFYVLPQSPQQLKQLLMVAGVDKYFQMPRCFRDEDQRGDRQPEFTQAEIEMSFVDQDDVLNVIERCLIELTKKHAPEKNFPKVFPRITWQEAMEKYGSDKPDVRFEMTFSNISEAAKTSGFGIFEKSEYLYALPAPKKYGELTRKDIDDLTELARAHGAGGLAWLRIGEESGPVAKNSTPEFLKHVQEVTGTSEGDLVFFGAGSFLTAVEPLGQVRIALGDKFGLRKAEEFAYLWVMDFPMFEQGDDGSIGASHHPFTRPLKEDEDILETDPMKARAIAYDVVMNGVELGGGSLRIHERDLQSKIFDILKITPEDAEARFGHMLRAFEYGAPPHGGLALGFDRVIMLFAEEPNIREVIPFPKNQTAQDLMLGAPSAMPDEQVEELGIQIIQDEEDNGETGVFKKIKNAFDTSGIEYELMEHKAVYTSEEAAEVRGTELKQGARALVVQGESGKFYLAVSSAAYEVDLEKLGKLIGESVKLADAKSVKTKTECAIGAVPPLGNILRLKTFVEENLLENEKICFNAGSNTRSILMKAKNFETFVDGTKGSFAK